MFDIKCRNNLLNAILLSSVVVIAVKGEPRLTARCGRPALPPKASKWLISADRSRFDDKEKVIIICKKNEFVHHSQRVQCKNGRWMGREPRCAQHIEAEVNHLDIFECDSPSKARLVSQPLNQSHEAHPDFGPVPDNAFHALRVPLNHVISAKGHHCYSFEAHFDRKVQIWFLTLDLWFSKGKNKSTNVTEVKPNVGKYRTCREQTRRVHSVGNDTVVGFYFFCDLNDDSLLAKEDSEPLNRITIDVRTNTTDDVGLEAVFIGRTFTQTMGSKTVMTDCGQIETKNIGVDVQEEMTHIYISCNDSFVDITGREIKLRSQSGNPK